MFPTKTAKAREELQGGQRTLSQRERALLLMADGRRSLTDFCPLFPSRDAAQQVLLALVERDYLQDLSTASAVEPELAVAPAGPEEIAPSTDSVPISTAADGFEGKRSLASTRMFLFDICERMFVRRDPDFAQEVRDALRGARDRESMLGIAALLLEEVERAAGPERAEALRERIDRLLPLADAAH